MKTTPTLTAQQVFVLKLIAQGYSTKDIARQIHRSARTIDTHRRQACAVLGVPNTYAAITVAMQENIIEIHSLKVQRTCIKNR